jgi:hypothetical protein
MEISEASSAVVGFVIVLIAMATRKKRNRTIHSVMIPVAYVQSQNKKLRKSKILQSVGKH